MLTASVRYQVAYQNLTLEVLRSKLNAFERASDLVLRLAQSVIFLGFLVLIGLEGVDCSSVRTHDWSMFMTVVLFVLT